jgi:hypothetical protein
LKILKVIYFDIVKAQNFDFEVMGGTKKDIGNNKGAI